MIHSGAWRISVAFLTFIACVGSCWIARAADTSQATRREYDVRDLLIEIPNFTDAPELGVQPEKVPEPPVSEPAPRTRQQSVRRLMEWIRRSFGQTEQTLPITESDGRFSVTTTSEAHRRLAQQLEKLREVRGLQVTLEARELSLATLQTLEPALAGKIQLAGAPGGKAQDLEDAEVGKLLRLAEADASNALVTAPRLTLFNGQRAYVIVSRQQAYVSGVVPAQKDGRHGFEASNSVVSTGLILQARAAVAEERSQVALDVQFTDVRLVSMKSQPAPNAPAGQGWTTQTPVLEKLRADQLLSAPSGRTLCVCLSAGEEEGAERKPWTVLLIKASIAKPGAN